MHRNRIDQNQGLGWQGGKVSKPRAPPVLPWMEAAGRCGDQFADGGEPPPETGFVGGVSGPHAAHSAFSKPGYNGTVAPGSDS